MTSTLQPRSMLFVSGERVERIPKALDAGADLVCIDLEDAVHPDRKAEARAAVTRWLLDHPKREAGPGVAVRTNGVRTRDGIRDMLALAEAGVRLEWLLLPRVDCATEVQCAEAWVGDQVGRIAALIETPLGVERAADIARAGGRMGALMLGGADLSTELGASFDWDGLLAARGRLVNAARAAGLQAWDVPHIALDDEAGLSQETRRVLGLGFSCKTAIHPKQLPVIHAAFVPSASELEWARALLQAVPEGQDTGAFVFQGRMVDAPVLRKARRIAALGAT